MLQRICFQRLLFEIPMAQGTGLAFIVRPSKNIVNMYILRANILLLFKALNSVKILR